MRLAILSCVLALGGCSDRIHPEFVARRWADTLSAFNIDPVFPPRHLQVGDVLLVLIPEEGQHADDLYQRRSMRLGRAEVRRDLLADMRTNLALPATADKEPAGDIFEPSGKIVSLPPTGYPGFNIAQVTEADLGVAFPVQAFRAVFGLASSHDLVMSISIPQAEDSELPAYAAYRAMEAFCYPKSGGEQCRLSDDPSRPSPAMDLFVGNLCKKEERPGTLLAPWVVFVNHVYYARRIDYAYTTKGGLAFNAAASLAAAAAIDGNGNATDGTSHASTGTTQQGADLGSDASKLAKSLQDRLDEADSRLGTTGGRLRVAYAGSEGTLLSQTFDRPVAIGYRGLWSRAGRPTNYCDPWQKATPPNAAARPPSRLP